MPESFATVEAVAKRYDTDVGVVVALDAVSATIPEGATTALVGVSGSGKSTLLRLLAGHELASSGRIVVAGADPARLRTTELRALRRETIAFVSQRAADNLFPHLTVAEHAPTGSTRIFEQLGIADRLGARAGQLSGGELARAAFAVALSSRTPFVVLDEPTAELDRESAQKLLEAIAAASADGTTFVLATHDPDVLAVADHVVELERGRNASGPHVTPAAGPGHGGRVVLRADGLSMSYDGVAALAGATLELRERELAVVVGRSGSGKSTLLMLLGGWQRPVAGTIEGEAVPGHAWSELAYVPQRFGLVPELTVRENVSLPARLGDLEGATDELLERLALVDLAERYPAQISVGQQQRVALARALCLRPRVLLVDEPTSHQDGASAERVWGVLREAADAGTACLVATHEPDARRRADTGWEIEGGRLR